MKNWNQWEKQPGLLLKDRPEQYCVSPDFNIKCWLQKPSNCKRLWLGIMSITINAADDESTFFLGEKFPTSRCFIGKVNNENITENTKTNSYLAKLGSEK
jgi:hypothetical protein